MNTNSVIQMRISRAKPVSSILVESFLFTSIPGYSSP